MARRDHLILVKAWRRGEESVISVEGEEVKENDLAHALERYVREGRDDVVIEHDAETLHSTIVNILDAAKAAKVKRVHVLHEEQP
jgi:biopolymer transport protein ExbD